MSTRLPSILRSSSNTPARRSLILALTLASLCFHLYLASLLSRVSSALSDTIASEQDDAGAGGEGGNWRRMELLRLGVGGVRLTSWLSAGVAGVGAVGVIRDHLPFLRLFTLNSFISLLLDLLLLSLISLTLFSSSSSSLPSSICSLLSSTDLSLDLFGYSLESCEERFGSFVLSAMGFTAAVAVCRAWGSVKTLEYYEALAKRQRRKLPSLSIASPNRYRDSGGEHYSATTPSSTSKRHQPSQRILLLPAESATSGKRDDSIPLLSLTAASPSRTSFPPIPHASTSSLPATEADEPRYLVYAPVFMTPDEARRVGAREIHISSSSSSSHGHRPRSRSAASPSKHSATSGLGQGGGTAMETPSEESLVTPIAEETEEEQRRMVVGSSANGKGKQA